MSPTCACTRAKSAVIASSSTYRLSPKPRVSLGGEATATGRRRRTATAARRRQTGVPTPAGVKNAGYPGAAGAHPFGERALRRQLHLQFTGEILPGELLVLADVRGGDPADPSRAQQHTQSLVVDAAVVGDDLEVGRTGLRERFDQRVGNAAQPEPADRQRRAAR